MSTPTTTVKCQIAVPSTNDEEVTSGSRLPAGVLPAGDVPLIPDPPKPVLSPTPTN